MTELKNEEKAPKANKAPQAPPSAPEGATIDHSLHTAHRTIEAPSGAVGGVGAFGDVSWGEATLESDLEMYFPDTYVPNDSERMLLYRELDNIRDDKELEAYRRRMVDRFGKLPAEAEELLQVVPLRRYGKQLGCEKIMLKQGRMFLYFVSNLNSPFYQSAAFDSIISFATQNVRRCQLREQSGKRSMVITDVASTEEAVKVLQAIMA